MKTCKTCNNLFLCACYADNFEELPPEKEIERFCKAMGGWKPYKRKGE